MQRVLQCPVQCFSEQNHKRHQDGLSWLNVRFSYYTLDFNLSWVAMSESVFTDHSRHVRFDQRTDFDQRRDPPHSSWTWEFEFWLSLKGRHYNGYNGIPQHSIALHVPVRSSTFHPGMSEVLQTRPSASMIQYAWELMNVLEDTRRQNLRCDPKDQLRPQIHTFGSFGGRDFAKRPAWWKESTRMCM